jgi:selenocysteine lyase/cysteine desulfurase
MSATAPAVDAYQSAGTVPLDVNALGADVVAAGTVKYLLGSAGLAFLFVRRGLIGELRPTATGWFADEDVFAMDDRDYSPASTAARFQSGTPPVPNIYAGLVGLRLVLEAGVERTAEHVAGLASALEAGVRELGGTVVTPDRRGALLCVESSDAQALVDELAAAGVVASWRDRSVRLSFHFYNDESDVEAALRALERRRGLL